MTNVVSVGDRLHGTLVPATWEHVEPMAETLDEADAAACRAYGFTPLEAVFRMWWPAMNKFTYLAGPHVAAMFGVCARPRVHHLAEHGKRTDAGELWCFTGKHLEAAAWRWPDVFKRALNELLKHYDTLQGHIDVENLQMIRLAKHVGGELEGPEPFGPLKRPFWKFTLGGA